MTLEVRIDNSSPQRVTLHLHGRLDALTYIEFDLTTDAVLRHMAAESTLVLDLSLLEYISSAGLRSIARIRKAMRARSGHTLVLNPQPQVRKVFDIIKAVPINEVFSNVQELDAYLDVIQKNVANGSLEGD